MRITGPRFSSTLCHPDLPHYNEWLGDSTISVDHRKELSHAATSDLRRGCATAALSECRAARGQNANAAAVQREAMAKLDFLKGRWKGESWTQQSSGPRLRSEGTETVESKLGGLLLTLEGVHRRASGDQSGEVVHHAFAVVSYDEKLGRYRFQAFTERGGFADAHAKAMERKLEWHMLVAPSVEMRYTITLNDRGQWFEIGEVSRDGNEWAKVFEMTLTREQTP